jgi:hypothetical protein
MAIRVCVESKHLLAHKKEKRPVDMDDVAAAIAGARRAVLFLAFYPGSPNVAQWAADAQTKNKELFVRGCVTNPSASESFYYQLHGATPPKKVKGKKVPRKEDLRVVAAQALSATSAPPSWLKEILKIGLRKRLALSAGSANPACESLCVPVE